jgi:hypothetical protein
MIGRNQEIENSSQRFPPSVFGRYREFPKEEIKSVKLTINIGECMIEPSGGQALIEEECGWRWISIPSPLSKDWSAPHSIGPALNQIMVRRLLGSQKKISHTREQFLKIHPSDLRGSSSKALGTV